MSNAALVIYEVCSTGECKWTRDGSGNWTVASTCTGKCDCFDPSGMVAKSLTSGQSNGKSVNETSFLAGIKDYNAAADESASRLKAGTQAPIRKKAVFTSKSGTSTASSPAAGDVYVTECYKNGPPML